MIQSLLITGFYAGILAIIHIALSFKVIGLRKQHKIGIGDGENQQLAKAIRVHGNFIENVPLALILLALAESNGSSGLFLHALGGLLVSCRFLHAIGLNSSIGTSWQRFVGMVGTFVVLLVLALNNVIAVI